MAVVLLKAFTAYQVWVRWSIAEYTTPYAPVPRIPFSSSERPRNIPILDSGVGGGHLDCGGGVDGGVGNGLAALYMAKKKTGDSSWRKMKFLWIWTDRTERNPKETDLEPLGPTVRGSVEENSQSIDQYLKSRMAKQGRVSRRVKTTRVVRLERLW